MWHWLHQTFFLVSVLWKIIKCTLCSAVELTVLFMGRDAVLILMTFYMRYTTLPHPVWILKLFIKCYFTDLKRTWQRYWDVKTTSVKAVPSTFGKVRILMYYFFLQIAILSVKYCPAVGTNWEYYVCSCVPLCWSSIAPFNVVHNRCNHGDVWT